MKRAQIASNGRKGIPRHRTIFPFPRLFWPNRLWAVKLHVTNETWDTAGSRARDDCFARRPPQSTEHRARRAAAASRAGPGCLAPFQHRPIRVDEARAISKRSRRTPSADAQHASSLAARLGGTPAACGVQRRERSRDPAVPPTADLPQRRSPARRAWGSVLCRNLRLSPPNLQHSAREVAAGPAASLAHDRALGLQAARDGPLRLHPICISEAGYTYSDRFTDVRARHPHSSMPRPPCTAPAPFAAGPVGPSGGPVLTSPPPRPRHGRFTRPVNVPAQVLQRLLGPKPGPVALPLPHTAPAEPMPHTQLHSARGAPAAPPDDAAVGASLH